MMTMMMMMITMTTMMMVNVVVMIMPAIMGVLVMMVILMIIDVYCRISVYLSSALSFVCISATPTKPSKGQLFWNATSHL